MLGNTPNLILILTGLGVALTVIIVLAAFVRRRATASLVGLMLICAFFAAVVLFMRPGRRFSMTAGPWAPSVTVQTWQDAVHTHEVESRFAQVEAETKRFAEATLKHAAQAEQSGDALALRYLEPPDVTAPPAPAPPASPETVKAKLRDAIKTRVARVKESIHEPGIRGRLGTGFTALAIAAFLFVGYVFLDASTRGQFTWSLRILSAIAFGLIFAVASMLRH